jgi:protein SCO1/2
MDMTGLMKMLETIRRFLVEAGFPVFAITLLFCWVFLVIGILLVPTSPTPLGAFAEDFRIWCFGYDPATGQTQWAYVMSMILPPIMMAAFIVMFWWEPLSTIRQHPRTLAFHAGAAALLVAGSATGIVFAGSEPATGELPFPAEALRTEYHPPQLVLTNQRGEEVDLEALRGHVVLLTAVYASCPHTCPVILNQAKQTVAELSPEEQEDLRIIAVTMDPSNDSSEVLAQLAANHGMQAPLYNLVTGPEDNVERILDEMQVARSRDPETGIINHANLFILIDRDGRLAYRLGLGERQQRWLTSALKVLLNESSAPS